MDAKYFEELKIVRKRVLERTFIDTDTEPYIRDFTDEEVEEWLKEDARVY